MAAHAIRGLLSIRARRGRLGVACRYGGYDEPDITLWSSSEVAAGARELQQSASVIARIFGAEIAAMDKHIELADAGYTFVVAYCPSDLDTQRLLMNVARRFRYGLAQKYDRFTITKL
jgi:hypothetical protein